VSIVYCSETPTEDSVSEKMNVFPSSVEREEIYSVSKGFKRLCVSPIHHLKKETDPVSKTLNYLFFKNTGR
jgi:hypothetical protein